MRYQYCAVINVEALGGRQPIVRFYKLLRLDADRGVQRTHHSPGDATLKLHQFIASSSHRRNVDELLGLARLGVDFFKRRNTVVPFEQRRRRTDALDGMLVQLPYRIEHWMIVRVENILLELGMPGNMNLRDAIGGNAVQVIIRIEAVILRRDINVVDVQ